MSGHSHWATIKHKKGALDAKRGKLWSKLSRAIIIAARNGGGDPTMNLKLRYAIDKARAVSMPKDNIERAIKRGTGDVAGLVFEEITYEGFGPGGVAILVDVLTDNRNRTNGEVRKIFERGGLTVGDVIVSIGAFEHFKIANYGAFFARCHELLPDGGLMDRGRRRTEPLHGQPEGEGGALRRSGLDQAQLPTHEPRQRPAQIEAQTGSGRIAGKPYLTGLCQGCPFLSGVGFRPQSRLGRVSKDRSFESDDLMFGTFVLGSAGTLFL